MWSGLAWRFAGSLELKVLSMELGFEEFAGCELRATSCGFDGGDRLGPDPDEPTFAAEGWAA